MQDIRERVTYLLLAFQALLLLLFGPDFVNDVKILPLYLRLVDLLVECEHVHEQVACFPIRRHQGVKAGLTRLKVHGDALWEN